MVPLEQKLDALKQEFTQKAREAENSIYINRRQNSPCIGLISENYGTKHGYIEMQKFIVATAQNLRNINGKDVESAAKKYGSVIKTELKISNLFREFMPQIRDASLEHFRRGYTSAVNECISLCSDNVNVLAARR